MSAAAECSREARSADGNLAAARYGLVQNRALAAQLPVQMPAVMPAIANLASRGACPQLYVQLPMEVMPPAIQLS